MRHANNPLKKIVKRVRQFCEKSIGCATLGQLSSTVGPAKENAR